LADSEQYSGYIGGLFTQIGEAFKYLRNEKDSMAAFEAARKFKNDGSYRSCESVYFGSMNALEKKGRKRVSFIEAI
jgi:hypothetical protein